MNIKGTSGNWVKSSGYLRKNWKQQTIMLTMRAMKAYNGSQTPVGVDIANGYGLYDIAGNVSEDCWDWSDSGYYGNPGAETNPHGPTTGTYRVLRGGSAINGTKEPRCGDLCWRLNHETNPILEEIRQTRDDLAREAGYNLKRLFEFVRERERRAAARGVKFVSFAEARQKESTAVLREEPPKLR